MLPVYPELQNVNAPVTLFRSAGSRVEAWPYELFFNHPFRLAHGERNSTQIVVLQIEHRGATAWGEASLPPYLGTTEKEVLTFFAKLPWNDLLEATLAEALGMVGQAGVGHLAAKAAVDIALHDLHGKFLDKPVYALLELLAPEGIHTTFTIGLSTPAELDEKLIQAAPFRLVKLKLGGPDDRASVDAFLARCTLPFCVDVNQGWTDRDAAARLSEYLLEKGALFIEQPMPVGREEDVQWLKARVPVPMIADESVRRLSDVAHIAGFFDGINVKLMKSTGIAEAAAMMRAARTVGLKVFLGAMAESSCAVTAAAHLATLADWVDLDGPLLIRNDPFTGITYHEGAIRLPELPGTGACWRG